LVGHKSQHQLGLEVCATVGSLEIHKTVGSTSDLNKIWFDGPPKQRGTFAANFGAFPCVFIEHSDLITSQRNDVDTSSAFSCFVLK